MRHATLLGAALLAGGLRGPADPPAPAAPSRTLVAPDVGALPALDGELDDAAWQAPVARTGAFADARGDEARPYSDARIAWASGDLVLALYAADEDVRTRGPSADAFHVTIGAASFDVTAEGVLRGAPPGTRVGRDLDGTPDDPSDDDEEWVLEIAVPLASIGARAIAGERVDVVVSRCDTPKRAPRACGSSRRIEVVLGARR